MASAVAGSRGSFSTHPRLKCFGCSGSTTVTLYSYTSAALRACFPPDEHINSLALQKSPFDYFEEAGISRPLPPLVSISTASRMLNAT
ncbi:unnamed protein product [Strongylus vulgaris]|uniref:Uncharacterized protein n=1 Tax=Strongylus vulgaris TaxID=40348 RepID=A0A3P7JG87_STRVU|nr:unnamed protein product [Strongylus vulgaris]